MNNISEIVDSLENRVRNLLREYTNLENEKYKLEAKIASLEGVVTQYKEEIAQWQKECESLKFTNSILGSDKYKRETKLKINELVREIDKCIIQLSE